MRADCVVAADVHEVRAYAQRKPLGVGNEPRSLGRPIGYGEALPAVDRLRELLQSDSTDVRAGAAQALGWMREEASLAVDELVGPAEEALEGWVVA